MSRASAVIRSVHPRACGEHPAGRGDRKRPDGSSPRLRGTRPAIRQSLPSPRFIPAPAGNTRPFYNPALLPTVHPRACGEHQRSGHPVVELDGSSPRLRGTQPRRCRGIVRARFIPAPAGNTPSPLHGRRPRAVHPRACGEHASGNYDPISGIGSSPRLRGTLVFERPKPRVHRFIPAPAGNTAFGASESGLPPVHPRACGEHAPGDGRRRRIVGSSPRLRGTHERHHHDGAEDRFIPAPAGNTRRPTRARPRTTVHPRACGEHCPSDYLRAAFIGSSPRLRGTPEIGPDALELGRFIPAPAGNTASAPPWRRVAPVHPRACGEHFNGAYTAASGTGSSPRLRGTRCLQPSYCS